MAKGLEDHDTVAGRKTRHRLLGRKVLTAEGVVG